MRFVVTWLTLAGFWIALSGYFDPIHLTFGFVSVTIVSVVASQFFAEKDAFLDEARGLFRLALYSPWLLGQVVVANLDVLLRVVGIRPLAPRMVRFNPNLKSDFGRVSLANSITLTPGTVTVEIEDDGTFVVHALSKEAADGVLDGRMVEQVRHLEEPLT